MVVRHMKKGDLDGEGVTLELKIADLRTIHPRPRIRRAHLPPERKIRRCHSPSIGKAHYRCIARRKARLLPTPSLRSPSESSPAHGEIFDTSLENS